jgi:hypothetical protein
LIAAVADIFVHSHGLCESDAASVLRSVAASTKPGGAASRSPSSSPATTRTRRRRSAGVLDPICAEDADFVIGSRFLAGGRCGVDMPRDRQAATRLDLLLVSAFCGWRVSESSNGYRAMRVAVLDAPRIDLDREWLDGYGLEVDLPMKLLKLGDRVTEVQSQQDLPGENRRIHQDAAGLRLVAHVGADLRRRARA